MCQPRIIADYLTIEPKIHKQEGEKILQVAGNGRVGANENKGRLRLFGALKVLTAFAKA
jgi:hypothetical protein